MLQLKPAYMPVNICYATNENYAPYLAVSMYSLLCNADKARLYDIVILHSAISYDSVSLLERVGALFSNCTVRLVDMTEFRERVKDATHAYITAETNYRLAILGELFAAYDRVLYLDCDTIVEGDISETVRHRPLRKIRRRRGGSRGAGVRNDEKRLHHRWLPLQFRGLCQEIYGHNRP